jgi:glutathione S-transferase
MKLFYKAGACSLAPHIALLEAGLSFSLESVDLKTKRTESGADFFAINSKGYVPALQLDDGQVLTENAAILQYVADLKPELGLAPQAASRERYQLQEWLSFISTELHKGMGSMFNPAQTPEWREVSAATLSKRLDWLVANLGDRAYLMGDHFTVADGYLFTVLSWSGHVGFDLSPWPTLQTYRARVGERSSVVAALKAEGLI